MIIYIKYKETLIKVVKLWRSSPIWERLHWQMVQQSKDNAPQCEITNNLENHNGHSNIQILKKKMKSECKHQIPF